MRMMLCQLAVAVLATPPPPPGLCATLGCSTHKMDGRSCQCNFHCDAHHDCCSDYKPICPNQTDPCLEHKCKAHGGAASGSAPAAPATGSDAAAKAKKDEHKETKTHAASGGDTAASAKGSGSAHEKAPSKDAKATTAAPSGKKEKTDEKKGHHEHTASKSGGSSSSGGGSGGSSGGSSSSSSGGGAAKAGEPKNGTKHEHEKKPEHEKKAPSDHVKGAHSGRVSWIIVGLACATGLTIPITVSIVLILRARGVCCAPAGTVVHQRIDRPGGKPETAAGLPTVPEGVEAPSTEGFDGFSAAPAAAS